MAVYTYTYTFRIALRIIFQQQHSVLLYELYSGFFCTHALLYHDLYSILRLLCVNILVTKNTVYNTILYLYQSLKNHIYYGTSLFTIFRF